MLKSEDVVTHMHQNFNHKIQNVNFLFPLNNNIDSMISNSAFVPFDDTICSFLHCVSQKIMSDDEAKRFPDIITFGFFCRKAHIEHIKKEQKVDWSGRLGRGITFHIAPSNVPINFAYSLVVGLLSGNCCIVRASSKDFEQTRILCRIFNEVSQEEEFDKLRKIFAIVMYNHDADITANLSILSDVRLIWGGDNTIAEIRKAPLKPRAFDITFADRYSFSVFDAGYILSQSDASMQKIAQDFYNDTYLYDQNACSSPHLIVWNGSGEKCLRAKKRFWDFVQDNIANKYDLDPILSIDKLSMKFKCAIELQSLKIEQCADNRIVRISLLKLPENIEEYSVAGGFYLEYETEDLNDIVPIVTQKYQTLSYLGMESERLQQFVIVNRLKGIDRIVPVGKSSDFILFWDGYDLINIMSRIVYKL